MNMKNYKIIATQEVSQQEITFGFVDTEKQAKDCLSALNSLHDRFSQAYKGFLSHLKTKGLSKDHLMKTVDDKAFEAMEKKRDQEFDQFVKNFPLNDVEKKLTSNVQPDIFEDFCYFEPKFEYKEYKDII